jgi:hypothetical protein
VVLPLLGLDVIAPDAPDFVMAQTGDFNDFRPDAVVVHLLAQLDALFELKWSNPRDEEVSDRLTGEVSHAGKKRELVVVHETQHSFQEKQVVVLEVVGIVGRKTTGFFEVVLRDFDQIGQKRFRSSSDFSRVVLHGGVDS